MSEIMSEITSCSTTAMLPDGTTVITTVTRIPGREGAGCALQAERTIQRHVNSLGCLMLQAALQHLDTEGEPIFIGKVRYTSKGRQSETYQSSFGEFAQLRHVYQGPQGGATVVPFEDRARMVRNATPLWASALAAKFAESPAQVVAADLRFHHAREVSAGAIAQVAADVAEVMLRKEPHWRFHPQTAPEEVASIALGIDGTCVHEIDAGWKTAMASTFTLLNAQGQALETLHLANAPEEGKATIFSRVSQQVERLKAHYPQALWVGLSDGAADLRELLEKHCDQLMLDYYHAAEYLAAAAPAMAQGAEAAALWSQNARAALRDTPQGAQSLWEQMRRRQAQLERQAKAGQPLPGAEAMAKLAAAVRYFANNLDRMDYAEAKAEGLPIGSGVTEAACKTIIKGRLGRSGMRWHRHSMQQTLMLRATHRSSNRWEQFWRRLAKEGL